MEKTTKPATPQHTIAITTNKTTTTKYNNNEHINIPIKRNTRTTNEQKHINTHEMQPSQQQQNTPTTHIKMNNSTQTLEQSNSKQTKQQHNAT